MDDARFRLLAPVGAITLLALTAAYVQLSPTPGYTSTAPSQPAAVSSGAQAAVAADAPPPSREQVVTVRRGTITDAITLTGRIGADDETPLSFPSPQRIAAVKVNPGDDVQAGQVIVEADRAELARALGVARERLSTATARLRQAEDVVGRQQRRNELRQSVAGARTQRSLVDAEAAMRQAEADYERIRAGASPAERRAAEMAVASARAAYVRAEADVRKLGAGPDDLEYRQADQAVLTAQIAWQKSQSDYEKLLRGPEPDTLRAAEREYLTAQNALSRAQADLQKLIQPDPTALLAAEREVERARAALRVAEIAASSSVSTSSSSGSASSARALRAERDAAVLNARLALQTANERLDAVRAGAPASEVMMARRNVTTSESAVASARDRLEVARQGPDGFALTQAQLAVETSRLAYEAALTRFQKLSAGAGDDLAGAVYAAFQSAESALRGAEAQQAEILARPTSAELNAAEELLRKARDTLAQARSESEIPPEDPVEQTTYDLAVLQQVVDQEQTAIAALENDLNQAQVVAPFEGRIVAVGVRVRDGVDAGKPVAVIAKRDAAPLVIAEAPVADGARLSVGQPATLKYGGATAGEAQAPLAEISTAGASTVRVILRPAWSGAAPALGSPVSVSVVAEQRENVTLVPEAALRGSGLIRVVEILNGQDRRQAEVSVGLIANGDAEIQSGLSEGDRVVLAP